MAIVHCSAADDSSKYYWHYGYWIWKRYHKTLETSVINSPMSPPSQLCYTQNILIIWRSLNVYFLNLNRPRLFKCVSCLNDWKSQILIFCLTYSTSFFKEKRQAIWINAHFYYKLMFCFLSSDTLQEFLCSFVLNSDFRASLLRMFLSFLTLEFELTSRKRVTIALPTDRHFQNVKINEKRRTDPIIEKLNF